MNFCFDKLILGCWCVTWVVMSMYRIGDVGFRIELQIGAPLHLDSN